MGERRGARRRATSRTRTTSSSPSTRAARTGTCARSSTRSSLTASPRRASTSSRLPGPCPARGTSCRRAARRRRRTSGSAATCAGSSSISTTSTRLGANAIYMTPIFPAGSIHRYDASSFDRVDPLLGGDEALASLVAAAHARGIHVLGDFTPNHCGRGHEWFQRALADPSAPEREFFFFDEGLKNGYESWYGVPIAPEAELGLRGAARAHAGRRPPLARAAVLTRRLAHRRGQHGRPLPRGRPQPRRCARDPRGCGRQARRRRARSRLPAGPAAAAAGTAR